MQDIRYCTKEPCQVAKPVVITTTTWTGKGRKRTPPDTGLEHTLGQKARYVKAIPNQDKVKEFAHMLVLTPTCSMIEVYPNTPSCLRNTQ